MNSSLIGACIMLGTFLAIAGCITVGVMQIKKKARQFAREAFGTNSLREGFARVEEEYASTPKSVAAMTSLCLPKIKKDFPEFQYDEMKVRAENVLTSYLMSIGNRNASELTEGSKELRDRLEMYISGLKARGEKENFDKIRIHRTEIADYQKRNGRCIITFQTALQYMHSLKDEEGKLLDGAENRLEQARYNVNLIYIQDRGKIQEERDYGLGINCPNCGAPLESLGSKKCAFCGTPILELNIYAWTFSEVVKL